MPFTVNGIGTTMCPGRGRISWQPGNWWQQAGSGDYDGVACLCFLYLPILPYSAVHAYGRSAREMGEHFFQIPIRWSIGLVIRAFLYRWLVAAILVGILFGVVSVSAREPRADFRFAMLPIGGVLIAIGVLGRWLLHRTDRRNHDLRRVMIATPFGSSDPVTWTDELLKAIHPPNQLFGSETFREAAEKALGVAEFGKAMLAARYCAAVEDASAGESLTDEILRHPDVIAGLMIVNRDPYEWQRFFGAGTDTGNLQPPVSAIGPASDQDDRFRSTRP